MIALLSETIPVARNVTLEKTGTVRALRPKESAPAENTNHEAITKELVR